MTNDVAVVGSLNLDLVVNVPRLPGPGETVVGTDVFRNPGGKGANQAVAAARLGRRVAMVGRVGGDDAGRQLRDALVADGVDDTFIRTLDAVPSGTALIAVAPDGENQIVVSPGANGRLSEADVSAATSTLSAAAVTLLQLEVPLVAVRAAASAAGGLVVLNPAPARALPDDLLERVDVLVPNRVELAQLTRADPPLTLDQVAALAASLPARAVTVTLGAEGALVVERGRPGRTVHVSALPVQVVDSTAAGDAFCGGLADALARGRPLEEAVAWAVRVAAAACTAPGAQASLPTRAQALVIGGNGT